MDACTTLVKARCQRLDGCTNMLGVKVAYGDEATCESRGVSECVDAIMAMGSSATPDHDVACATAIGSESCEDFFDNIIPTACIPAAGTIGSGDACGANAQCESTFCSVTKDTICGACADLPMAGVSCAVNADCGRNLVCVKDAGATAGSCAAPVTKGGPCLRAGECTAGTACVGAKPAQNMKGTCQAQGTMVGAACDAKRTTLADCDKHLGLYCSPAGMCEDISFVDAGMPCGIVGAGMSATEVGCTGGALCVIPNGTTQGTCVAPAADGAACDDTKGPPCMDPSKCVAGKCTEPDATTCK